MKIRIEPNNDLYIVTVTDHNETLVYLAFEQYDDALKLALLLEHLFPDADYRNDV